jgi:sulfatase modifying factor 1
MLMYSYLKILTVNLVLVSIFVANSLRAGNTDLTKHQVIDSIAYLKSIKANMVKVKGGKFRFKNWSDSIYVPKAMKLSTFYMAKYELTVAEFAEFISETGYLTDAEMLGTNNVYSSQNKLFVPVNRVSGVNWRHDENGFLRSKATYNHPVIHVSYNDAVEYCRWLTQKTGTQFRLPYAQEWEYAAANRDKGRIYSWGNGLPQLPAANVADQSLKEGGANSRSSKFENYNDGYIYSAPVGSCEPAKLGLHDMTGNVWEWCANVLPGSQAAYIPFRMIRGGSWNTGPEYSMIGINGNCLQNSSEFDLGFRVVMIPSKNEH